MGLQGLVWIQGIKFRFLYSFILLHDFHETGGNSCCMRLVVKLVSPDVHALERLN